MSEIRKVGCAASNFRQGRPVGQTPRAIVLHRSGGSLAEVRARFADPTSALSAHYGVGRDGTIEEYVAESDTAFHAGVVLDPTWAGLTPKVNPNFYTIGIEHEAGPDWPEAQRAASAGLIAEIAGRWSIPIIIDNVVAHSAIRASVSCPGLDCPIAAIVDLAQRSLDAATVAVSTDEMELHGSTGQPAIDRKSLALPPEQYYPQVFPKDLLILHFTAGGSARSAVDTWRANPEHVATAYVVDVDATIYEVFPPQFWAYHLGLKGGTAHERRTIGIEIANVGPLQQSNGDPAVLNWWPSDWKTKYCRLDETDRYVRANYRGKQFFASFPEPQVAAVGQLVRHLCAQFDIERELMKPAGRLACDLPAFAGFKGIATHANCRADKWDVGPAFDWDRLGI
jgi:N-acetyl-anhydromuramyl-L-alanine amidase AmpD